MGTQETMMVEIKEIKLEYFNALGVKVDLPKAPLLLIKADKGFLMCGYLNLEAAEKLGDTAAVIRGVSSFDEMLDAKVVGLTSGAKALGIQLGDKGCKALECMIIPG
jgi:uncharacterized protein YunC (DUF1805 family)